MTQSDAVSCVHVHIHVGCICGTSRGCVTSRRCPIPIRLFHQMPMPVSVTPGSPQPSPVDSLTCWYGNIGLWVHVCGGTVQCHVLYVLYINFTCICICACALYMRRKAKHYYMYVVSASANTRAAFDEIPLAQSFFYPCRLLSLSCAL